MRVLRERRMSQPIKKRSASYDCGSVCYDSSTDDTAVSPELILKERILLATSMARMNILKDEKDSLEHRLAIVKSKIAVVEKKIYESHKRIKLNE